MLSAVRYTFLTPHAHRRGRRAHVIVQLARTIISVAFSFHAQLLMHGFQNKNANRGSAFAFLYFILYVLLCVVHDFLPRWPANSTFLILLLVF
jgi:hypothetical protein